MSRPLLSLWTSLILFSLLFPAVVSSSDSPTAKSKPFLPELPSARFLPPDLDDATERQIIETAYQTPAPWMCSSSPVIDGGG